MTRRSSRHDAPAAELAQQLEEPRAEALENEKLAATQAIGARQEVVTSKLEGIAELLEQLQALKPLVDEMREPLNEELIAYRQHHTDLITTRAVLEQTSDRLEDVRRNEAKLAARVDALEGQLEDARLSHQRAEASVEAYQIDLGQLRDAKEQVETSAAGLTSQLRDAELRGKQLEEDAAILRAQGEQDADRYREIDTLLANASQAAQIDEEEAAAIRRRLEQAETDLARLNRAEADAQGLLKTERARAHALSLAGERAQAEVLNLGRALEERSEVARSELAAMSIRVETLTARSAKLEALNASLIGRLSDADMGQRQVERHTRDLQVSLDRANERVEQLEGELGAQRANLTAIERARMAAVERGDQLGRTLQAQDTTVRRAEERLRELQARIDAVAADQELARRALDQQKDEAAAEMERLRAELTMSEAGLQAARRDRSRPASIAAAAATSDGPVPHLRPLSS